ncbi:MAG TPA: enoyl-CoA hydratase [Bauldia sp.]|nr:enoyl-CoA hydratase [Bauldia sp.]
MAFETIVTETRGRVALITLNRPNVLNALNATLIGELGDAVSAYDADQRIGCMILSGSDKAFAAGADIKEMQGLSFAEAFRRDYGEALSRVARARKPIVAAVAGYCLGGGCELAMICDIVIAADTARFGQPEITLGIMPGLGGTQRLPRAVGKAKAMDLILTGRMMDAAEAERSGLVSRVVAANDLLEEAMRVAEKIAGYSLPIVMMAKESVNRSFEMPLSEGIRFERRLFHAMFATEDQKEGMAAFIEKRSPQFRNR